MSATSASTAVNLLYDHALQERYLEAVSRGLSATAAARSIGMSPARVRTALANDPHFARRELEARLEATDAVEDSVYALATGRHTEAERQYHEAERQRLLRKDVPEDDIPLPAPPRPDLRASTLWLERRSPARWQPEQSAQGGVTVNVQTLITPEGAQSFRQTLESRRAEALSPAMTALPAASGEGE